MIKSQQRYQLTLTGVRREANKRMTLHTLVHSCDSFSYNCNSIHSFVSIVFHCDLRAFSSFLFLLLRVYINYRDSSTSHFIHVQQCDYIYQNKYLQVYIRTSVFVSFETNETNAFQSTLVCWPIMQHGVRIEAVFASLQQGEHIVESMQFPAYIQSSRQLQE